jgi:hypothetical protein
VKNPNRHKTDVCTIDTLVHGRLKYSLPGLFSKKSKIKKGYSGRTT